MKTMIELTKYHGHSYLKSNKYVMPLAVFFVLLYVNYSIIPLRVIDSFCISCVYAFMIMVWAGIGYNESEPLISRQILVLRVQSASRYYISDSAFFITAGIRSQSPWNWLSNCTEFSEQRKCIFEAIDCC